jgi:hypothetical protein
LAKDDWILFARRVHLVVHDAIMDAARLEGICPKHAHDTITAQQAVHLVSEHAGVTILTKPTAGGVSAEGIVLKPISDTSLYFETCVIMRTDDDSPLANEFALPPQASECHSSAGYCSLPWGPLNRSSAVCMYRLGEDRRRDAYHSFAAFIHRNSVADSFFVGYTAMCGERQ